MNAKTHHNTFEFKGFDDWFEIFCAGEHEDSNGNIKEWTHAELDTMVANHVPVPLVFGHPKTNAPAYGWTEALKRDGDVLLAKATDVVEEFAEAVKKKMWPNRSSSFVADGKGGFKLRHIGFLGAHPPAIDGLKALDFNQEAEAITFEFAVEEAVRSQGYVLQTVGNAFRRIKNWFIAEKGLEQADELLPDWMIDSLGNVSADTRAALAEPANQFSSHNNHDTNQSDTKQPEGAAMPNQFSQADMDAAIAKAKADAQADVDAANARAEAAENANKEKQFAAMKDKAQAVIDTAVNEGRLLPAQKAGLAEFMASLAADAETTFEFAADDGTKKQTPYDFMAGFIGSLGKQIKLGGRNDEDPGPRKPSDFAAPAGTRVDEDRADLDRQASEYAQKHNVDYITAVTAVSGGR